MKINTVRFNEQAHHQLGVKAFDSFDSDIDNKIIPVYPVNEPKIDWLRGATSATGTTTSTIITMPVDTRNFVTNLRGSFVNNINVGTGRVYCSIAIIGTAFPERILVAQEMTYTLGATVLFDLKFDKPIEFPPNAIIETIISAGTNTVTQDVSVFFFTLPY